MHPTTILAATGHRPNKLGGYSPLARRKLFRFAQDYLASVMPDRVITGMALGWDQAIAQACADLDIPFVAAIPFEGQEARWPLDSQSIYESLLSKADSVVYVSLGDYAPWKMHRRNQFMVDSATRIAALWDGSSGGTGSCVAYVLSRRKPWENLWQDWLAFSPGA